MWANSAKEGTDFSRNCRHSRPNKKNNNNSNSGDNASSSTPPIKRNADQYKDTFGNLKSKDYIALVGKPQPAYARLQGKYHELMSSHRALRRLIRQKILVDIVHPNDADCSKPVPCLHTVEDGARFPVPGELFKLAGIVADGLMQHNDRARPVTSGCKQAPSIYVISESYKNDREGFLELVNLVTAWRENPNDTKLYDAMTELAFICGCGGMPKNQGDVQPNSKEINSEDPLYDMPVGQPFGSPKNQHMERMYRAGTPFALYINMDTFTENEKPQEERVVFLGYFYFKSMTETMDEDSELQAHFNTFDCSAGYKKLSGFRQGQYRKLRFASILGTEDWRRIIADNNARAYRRIEISAEDEAPMDIKIAVDDVIALTPTVLLDAHITQLLEENEFDASGLLRGCEVARLRGCVVDGAPVPVGVAGTSKKRSRIVSQDDDDGADDSAAAVISPTASAETDGNMEMELEEEETDEETEPEEEPSVIPLVEDVEEDEQEPVVELRRGTKATVSEVVRVGLTNQFVGALRFAGKGLVDAGTQEKLVALAGDERKVPQYFKPAKGDRTTETSHFLNPGTTAMPLHGEASHYITEGMCRHSTPMSMPCMDRNGHMMLEEMEKRGFQREHGKTIDLTNLDQAEVKSTMYDTLFSVIIFRVLGRVDQYKEFGRRMNLPNYLPKPDQLDVFLEHMQEMMDVFGIEAMNKWISSQHKKSIPPEWFQWAKFQQFATGLKKQLKLALDAYFEKHKGINFGQQENGPTSAHHKDMIDTVFKVLDDLSQSKLPEGKLEWLSQMMVGDLYDLFDEPFGTIISDNLVAGSGSGECLVYYQNAGDYRKKKVKKQAHFRKALQHTVVEVRNNVPDDCLAVGGLYRDIDGKVRQIINGVEVGPRNAEMMMCKFYLHIKFTLSHYRKTFQPKSSAPHCWPCRWRHRDEEGKTDALKNLKRVMLRTIEAYREVMIGDDAVAKEYLTVPEIVQLPAEEIVGIHKKIEGVQVEAASSDSDGACSGSSSSGSSSSGSSSSGSSSSGSSSSGSSSSGSSSSGSSSSDDSSCS